MSFRFDELTEKKDDPTNKENNSHIYIYIFLTKSLCGFRKAHSTINTPYFNYYIVDKKGFITLVSVAEFSWNTLKRVTA